MNNSTHDIHSSNGSDERFEQATLLLEAANCLMLGRMIYILAMYVDPCFNQRHIIEKPVGFNSLRLTNEKIAH